VNYEGTKRAFDLAGGTLALLLLAPLIAATALAVRLDLGSPVLFRQPRSGRHGCAFTLLKFRTMRAGDAVDAVAATGSDAARLTRFGRLLRASSLDELPELVNVVRGDMSLVGPRPLLPEYLPLYDARQARRHEVRPGITGWAQVNGRNAISWEAQFELDVWYADNYSLALDLKILALTLLRVVARTGVTQPGQATREPFRGSGP